MTRLTDIQLLILSKASQRADYTVILPETLNGVAAGKVVASLMKRQLVAETQASPDMPIWRTDPAGIRFALVITEAGLHALGVTDDTGLVDDAPATNEELDGQDAPFRRRRTHRLLSQRMSMLQRAPRTPPVGQSRRGQTASSARWWRCCRVRTARRWTTSCRRPAGCRTPLAPR